MAAPDHHRTDERLTQLEIKASYADDLLDELNALVWRQQQQIDRLTHELLALRERQAEQPGPAFRSLRDDIPPHY
ncbi:MAG TPA: SlyX family protein [Macromonas sp.]|nr:SlyX family protein [Macromonas sp.]